MDFGIIACTLSAEDHLRRYFVSLDALLLLVGVSVIGFRPHLPPSTVGPFSRPSRAVPNFTQFLGWFQNNLEMNTPFGS